MLNGNAHAHTQRLNELIIEDILYYWSLHLSIAQDKALLYYNANESPSKKYLKHKFTKILYILSSNRYIYTIIEVSLGHNSVIVVVHNSPYKCIDNP